MKIRDFIKLDIDIDVCDDYDESCYLAFCGPVKLTSEGERKFADVMNCDIDVHNDDVIGVSDDIALIHAESDKQVQKLKDFFFSAAGYCADSDFNKWFS